MNDIILSSRIRLARNFKDINFPSRLRDTEVADFVVKKIYQVLENEDLIFRKVKNVDNDFILSLLENCLISKALIDNKDISAFAINTDETFSLMVNEEDHIREQCIKMGKSLKECYEEIKYYDDLIINNIDIAYDKKMGFLTSCPSNVGTGMRASVMMFLPALTITNQIENIIKGLKPKITVRGRYGEGSDAKGYTYQISNNFTIGTTEYEIIDFVEQTCDEIMKKEVLARKVILQTNKSQVEDFVCRSLGILKNARLLSFEELFELISKVRFGVGLKIINLPIDLLDDILNYCSPYNISNLLGKNASEQDRNILRANLIREKLKGVDYEL